MPASYTAIRDIYARLSALHVRECEQYLRLSQEISAALAHYGPCIQALDGADPLYANFMTFYYQLALRRIEQFRQAISERASYLNCSNAVQEALHILRIQRALQCNLKVSLDHDSSNSKEESAQQINSAFLHLMICSKSLQHQLKELVDALEARINGKTARPSQGASNHKHFSCKKLGL